MSQQDSVALPKKITLYVILAGSTLYALYRFLLSILYFNRKYVGELPTIPTSILVGIVGSGSVLLFLLILKCIVKENDSADIFIPAFLLFSVFYLIVFQPLSVPDELAHFSTAYRLSNYILIPGKQISSDNLYLRNDDYLAVTQYFRNYLSSENFASAIEHFSFWVNDNGYTSAHFPNAISNAPFGYLFSAFGIAIARLLHLGSYPLFYFGRICNIIVFCVITYFAIRRIPYGKPILFVISLLPMTLHLAASYSYDGFAISSSFLFIANILYWCTSDRQMTRKDQIVAFLLALPICLTKAVYLPMCILLLLIPNQVISDCKKNAIIYKILSLLLIITAFILIFLPSSFGSVSSSDLVYSSSDSYTITWVLKHIPSTIKIFLRTLELDLDDYLSCMVGGNLGWFQISLTQSHVHFLYLFLALSVCITSKNEHFPSVYLKTTLSAIILLSGALIMASMFFAWTPFGAETIEGIQGRYFLPLLCPLCVVMKNRIISYDNSYQFGFLSIYLVFDFICFLHLFCTAYTY